MSDAETRERPALRIVRGEPTPEDIAVITALAASGGGQGDAAPRVRRGSWSDPSRTLRTPLQPGPNGWRAGRL